MNPWRRLIALPREVWVLFAATLINRAGTMALPFLVLYLTQREGLSAARAGVAITVYGLGALITSPLTGRLSDLVGSLRVMRASLLLSGLILFAFPLAEGFNTMLVLTFCFAVTGEAYRPASMAFTAEWVEPEQRTAAFSLHRLALNLGMSIGPAAGGLLATRNFQAIFWVDGATSLLAALVLTVMLKEAGRRGTSSSVHGAAAGGAEPRRSALSDRRLLYFIVALFPVQLVFFQQLAAVPLFVVGELHMTPSAFGLLIALNTGLIILFEVPLNLSLASRPQRPVLSAGALLVGVGFGALALAQGGAGVASAVVVWTVGEMLLLPASAAYVSRIAPREMEGEYMGLYAGGFSVAFFVGPGAGAEVLQRFGAAALWGGAFACGCASAVMLWALGRSRAGERDGSPQP